MIKIAHICIALLFALVGFSQGNLPCFTVVADLDENATSRIGLNVYSGEDEMWLDDENYDLESHGKYFFEEKTKLHSFFRCVYDFAVFEELGLHRVDKFVPLNMDDFAVIYLVHSSSSDLSYLIMEGSLYLVYPCGDEHTCFHPFYYPATFEVTQETILLEPARVDLGLGHTLFDTLIEQVLVHDAYNLLIVHPAVFDTVFMEVLVEEKLLCSDLPVSYDTLNEFILIKDAYSVLDTVDVVFETVTEQVLHTYEHIGLDSFALETKDSLVEIQTKEAYFDWAILDTIPACVSQDPFSCVEIELEEQDADSIIAIIEILAETCPEDYTTVGSLCVKETFIPHSYVTRSYEKLVSPSVIIEDSVPGEYMELEKIFFESSVTVPDSCVEEIYEIIPVYKLATPAWSETLEVPAVYETREFYRVLENANIDSVELEDVLLEIEICTLTEEASLMYGPYRCESFISEAYKEMILEKLVEENYLGSVNTVFNSAKFWRAFLQYQLDRNLPAGKIDTITLEEMGIE